MSQKTKTVTPHSSNNSSSYLHGLQISINLHSGHLLVPGGCQVPLDVQVQVDWFQQLAVWFV